MMSRWKSRLDAAGGDRARRPRVTGRWRRPSRRQSRNRRAPRVGVADAPLSITLADAIRMTLEQNNDVSIARLDTDIARQSVRVFEGVFDPRLAPNFGYQRNVDANTSAIGGATEGRLERTEIAGGAALTGRAPWAGGRFTVDFSASRLDTSNQFARLNPEFPSALSATWVQPLARGRSIDADRRNILLARRAVDLTDAQLTQVVMDQLTLVEEAYWDLAFAARNLDVLTQRPDPGAWTGREQPAAGHAGNARAHRCHRGTDPGLEVSAGSRVWRAGTDGGRESFETAHAGEPNGASLESTARARRSGGAFGPAPQPR